MALADRLAELKKYEDAQEEDCQNRQNLPSVSSVSPDSGTSSKNDLPSAPCSTCGSGSFYALGESWFCGFCAPPAAPPKRFLAVPGGRVAEGEPQDLDGVLRWAVTGTNVGTDQLHAALSNADRDDVRHGRVGARALHAFATTLDLAPVRPPRSVRCADCRHFRRHRDHLHLGTCSAGMPQAIAGLWDTDRRHCPQFSDGGGKT